MATVRTLTLLSGLVLLWAGALVVEAQEAAGLREELVRKGPTFTETQEAIECEEMCESTRVHPAMYFRTRQTRIGPSSCLQSAKDAVRKAGLINATSDAFGSGGTEGTARAAITCVTLPDAGPCDGDGATVIFMVASSKDASEATSLLDRLDTGFGNPVLFDCGTNLIPADQ